MVIIIIILLFLVGVTWVGLISYSFKSLSSGLDIGFWNLKFVVWLLFCHFFPEIESMYNSIGC